MSSAQASLKATERLDSLVVPKNRYVIFFSFAVVGCALDLLTKHWVFEWRGIPQPGQPRNVWWLWEGYIGVETTLNRGALFGMGEGFGLFFALLSIVAAAGILVWLFWFKAARDLLLTIALGCVTGGIFGNLYDRLGLWHDGDVLKGYERAVRDWVLCCYEDYTWPNFNIADSLLVCGAIMLAWHGFIRKEPIEQSESSGKTGA